MRRGDLGSVIEALKEPVRSFVRDSRVRIVLLASSSGQVLALHGFTRGVEIASVAALAAATNVSARALAGLTGGAAWKHLHHAGREHQLFLAPFGTPADELILVAIFDRDTSLGLVQFYFRHFADRIAAMPEFRVSSPEGSMESFEHELEAGVRYATLPDWLSGL